MCSRVQSPFEIDVLKATYGFGPDFNFQYSANVAPTDMLAILCSHAGDVKWKYAQFGLVPHWAKDKKKSATMINARSETIREKSAFASPYKKHRAIIPVQSYYEWRDEGGKKMPYRFSRKDGRLISLAGIWEFADINGEKIFSFSIVTGEAEEITRPYHDRAPLATDDVERWLDPDIDALDSFERLPADLYEITPMHPDMNSSREKDSAKIRPL